MEKTLGYSPFQRRLRFVAFALFVGFTFYYLGLVVLDFQFTLLPFVLLAFFLALLTIDFLSGLLHWAADTWGTVDWPLVGRSIIQSFRLHHTDQKGITRHDFLETNGDVAIVAVLVQIIGVILLQFFVFHYFLLCYFAFVTMIGSLTNQFHKWAHQERAAGFVRLLQKSRIILSPEHHGVHHTAPHESYYCITFGWLNPFLTFIGFFPILEKIITFCTGLQPRTDVVSHKKKIKVSSKVFS